MQRNKQSNIKQKHFLNIQVGQKKIQDKHIIVTEGTTLILVLSSWCVHLPINWLIQSVIILVRNWDQCDELHLPLQLFTSLRKPKLRKYLPVLSNFTKGILNMIFQILYVRYIFSKIVKIILWWITYMLLWKLYFKLKIYT